MSSTGGAAAALILVPDEENDPQPGDIPRSTVAPLHALLEIATHAAAEAAKILSSYYRGNELGVTQKADLSPVTAADMASSDWLCSFLTAESGFPAISEEQIPPPDEREQWTCYWLIDPLDGTQNFINRDGEFSVNVALIDNGSPVAGVINVPAHEICYRAARGLGAEKSTPGGWSAIANRRRGTASRIVDSKLPKDTGRRRGAEFLNANALAENSLARVGSAYKLGLLAEGQFDAAVRFDPMWEWDVAAGDCILRESGCRLIHNETLESMQYGQYCDLKIDSGYLAFRRNLRCERRRY